MQAAYLLFKMHHWSPEVYYNLSRNARAITRAFIKRQLEDMEAEAREIENNG
jgi:hypothetical protein